MRLLTYASVRMNFFQADASGFGIAAESWQRIAARAEEMYFAAAEEAAELAAEELRQRAQSVEADESVVSAIQVFREDDTVQVGIPKDDPAVQQAFDMEYGAVVSREGAGDADAVSESPKAVMRSVQAETQREVSSAFREALTSRMSEL